LGGGVVDISNTEKLAYHVLFQNGCCLPIVHEYRKNNQPCKILISGKGRGHRSEAELFSEDFKKMGVRILISLRKIKA
jgi:hypothetical protein